jgi:beta-lactamase class A
MRPEPTRRAVLTAAPALLAFAEPQPFEGLESGVGGRLGVYAIDLQSGRTLAHRAAERFPMCSTFKMLLAARILARADAGALHLGDQIGFTASDLLENSPVSKAHVGQGVLTLSQACEAIVQVSDNTAANLLLAKVGGPAGLTGWLRSLGDQVTRLDRTETSLNEARPGDPRDTTTPAAIVATWRKLLFGSVLCPGAGVQLLSWLEGNKTGDKRLRRGLPAGWRVGDKTGANSANTTNDIAVAFPPGRKPVLIAAMITQSRLSFEARDPVLAEVGRIVGKAFAYG